MMKLSSVRMRLTLWNVGILALALLVMLVTIHMAVRAYMLSSIDNRLLEITQRYEEFSRRQGNRENDRGTRERAVRENSSPSPTERNRASSRETPANWIRAFDQQGRMMSRDWQPAENQEQPWDRTALSHAMQGHSSFSTVKGDDAPLRVYTKPLLRNKQQVGVVQIVFSLHELEVLLDSLNIIMLVLAPCVLLLAGFGGLFLTSRALGPVRNITRAADALSVDDLSHRLPVVGGDEFAHLATTINHMLARLEGAFTQLTESIQRERRFTADASHELRTPLTVIKANTSLALKTERTPAQYRESLHAIDQASEIMGHLIQDLLLLARSDSGQLAVHYQEIAPEDLLHGAVAMANHRDGNAPVQISVNPEIGTLWGDPHHLQRLLVNLLENALRHTPASGEVSIAAHAQEELLAITITDTGEGIAPEHLPHLGERFYRVDAARTRQHGGAGLGLAICRSIVEAHHGTLTIESTPCQGTRVTILLPRHMEAG